MRETIVDADEYKPDLSSPCPFGRLSLPHGDTIFLNKKFDDLRHLSVLELPKGLLRGNHYHKLRTEYLYILKGNVWGYYWDPQNPGDARKILLTPGQIVTIPPGLAHAIEAVEGALAVEFSPNPFDITDYFGVDHPTPLTMPQA